MGTIYSINQVAAFRAAVKIVTKPNTAQQSKSNVNNCTLSSTTLDFLYFEFFPIGQRVNQELFLTVLRHSREIMRKKRPNVCVNMAGLFNTTKLPRKWRSQSGRFLRKKKQSKTPIVP
jgi:hypothetical protein